MLTYKMTNFRARKLLAALILAAPLGAGAADAPTATAADPAATAMRQALAQRYPNTKFGEINRSAVPGLWEVWMGPNVAYVTDEGRHFVFGHLYDMQTQTDLTAAKKEKLNLQSEASKPKISFSDLPFSDAIKTVRGNGKRQLAVFADPHCRYCQDLEKEMAGLDNVTIYTFLYPINSMGSGSAQSIWCAKDRAAAWKEFMVAGKAPPAQRCSTAAIDRNIELAGRSGINGTPYILFANGDKAAGLLDAASLELRLSRK